MGANKRDRARQEMAENLKRKHAILGEAPSTKDILQKIQQQKESLKQDERLANKARQSMKKNMEPRNKKAQPQSVKSSVRTTKNITIQVRNQTTAKVLDSRKKLQDLYLLLSHTAKTTTHPANTGTAAKSRRGRRK